MPETTQQSHASDPVLGSDVPLKVQQNAPKTVEEKLPESVHQTGNSDKINHATGSSIVPDKVAESLPTKVEEKVPNAIHDTSVSGKKSGDATRKVL